MRWLLTGPRVPTWISLAVVAASAWIAGLLLARFGWNASLSPDEAIHLTEVAGLPLPNVTLDLNPQYRALVEEAKEHVVRLVDAHPKDAQAIAALAHLHNLAHDDAGEVACWRRCLELDPNHLLAYSNLAMRAANRGEAREAEELLRRALQVPGASPGFAELLATVLSDQGKFAEAAAVLEDSLARRPPSARTHILLGEARLKLKEFQKAKEQFQKAIELDRSSTRAYHGLFQATARLGQADEAEKYRAEFARLRAIEDETGRKKQEAGEGLRGDEHVATKHVAQILTMAAKTHLSHGEADEAERCLLRAAELSSDDLPSRALLADLYASRSRLEEALAMVEQLRKLDPRNPAHLRSQGILQGRLGRWEAAEKTFQELCALMPDQAVGYAGLAESYLRSGKQLDQARALAAKAVALDPSAWNHFILGALCERLGDLDAARAALKKAVALEPNNPRYRQLNASLKGTD